MAIYNPENKKSKSGEDVIIRSADIKDAASILELAKAVINEEIYQLTSSKEFNITLEQEEKWIEAHLNNSEHIVLVAEMNSKIVGLLNFQNGSRTRIAHTGEFGMSVVKEFRNQGIGFLLLSSLIEWAEKNYIIEKINLSVHGNNERAIALYKKLGFEVEGVKKHELKYSENIYIDLVTMGRFV